MKTYILNLKRILVIGAIALCFVSCSDFMDKNPLDQISSEAFWSNEAEVKLALAGVYSRLQAAPYQHDDAKSDVMAGDSDANQGQSWVLLAQGQIVPTSGSLVTEIWNNSYAGISSCNFFLANVDKAPLPEAILKKYRAEVNFLRAVFYHKLVDVYGGVPVYTAPVTIEEAKIARSSKAEVITQILSDLDYAIANLPDIAYGDGHAVKASAQAFKARVLLYDSQWSAAAQAANDVIQGGKFSLFNNYRTLFLATGQTNNPEIIFSTRYLNPDASSDLDIRWNWHGVVNPRQELVDEYEFTDGTPFSTSNPLYDANDWKKNRDPRMALTVKKFAEKVINSAGREVDPAYNGQSSSGYNPVKYGNWDALPCDYSTKSEQDWILLRYADVLLMYAEATNEASGPNQSVYDAVNAVRARPGVNMPALPAGLGKDEMRERIRHERRVELGLEGLRWADIKRWKTAETYIPTLIDLGGTRRSFDKNKHYLMPIPQNEMDINPQLEQNPNY